MTDEQPVGRRLATMAVAVVAASALTGGTAWAGECPPTTTASPSPAASASGTATPTTTTPTTTPTTTTGTSAGTSTGTTGSVVPVVSPSTGADGTICPTDPGVPTTTTTTTTTTTPTDSGTGLTGTIDTGAGTTGATGTAGSTDAGTAAEVSPVADASPAADVTASTVDPATGATTSTTTPTTTPSADATATTGTDPSSGTGTTTDPATGTTTPTTPTVDCTTTTPTTTETTTTETTTPPTSTDGTSSGSATSGVDSSGATGGTGSATEDGGGVGITAADASGTAADIPEGTPVDPASLPAGTTSWDSDFTRSGLSKFKKTPWNNVGASAPVVTTSPADASQKGLRFTVPGGGQRSEVEPNIGNFREGDDRWFGYSIYLPADFPTKVNTWQLLTQWKNAGTGSPPLELTVGQGAIRLSGGYGHPTGAKTFTKTIAAADTGKRIDLVVHVKFSADPSKGSIEAFRDGKRVLAEYRPPGGTLYPNGGGASSYWKTGLYRDRSISQAGSYVLLRARVGTGYAAVTAGNPAAAAAAPATTTVPINPAAAR